MTDLQFIRQHVTAPEKSIQATLQLLEEACTIPFIARYRKDQTGNLDEVSIEHIAKYKKTFDELAKRKLSILESIEEQGKLTTELRQKIEQCFQPQELEDLYLPYKKRQKTRADKAREKGLEPLAKMLMAQQLDDPEWASEKYLTDEVPTVAEALQGARDIIAEWINENVYYRKSLRRMFQRQAVATTQVVKGKENDEEAQNFKPYFDFTEPLHKAPSHRLLAMLRAENLGFIRLQVAIDTEEALQFLGESVIKSRHEAVVHQLEKAVKDSYKRLLEPSISNEVLQEAKARADRKAIQVFADNAVQLLLAPPLGEKRILALDPGFRSGCKLVCLDAQGNLLHNENIYPHAPQNEKALAQKKLRSLVNAYQIEAIAIGNGTASRETEALVKNTGFDRDLQVFVVSEAGASVYSASKVAREEFPTFDVTVRGAISIGRRLSDPLAELVKIDPKAIGVGQYQHDVDQSMLKEELDTVVKRCVNTVGVNVNTASKHLLSQVSGIGEKLAENLVAYRAENGAFTSRSALKKVPRLGDKAFQQAAAFVRVPQSNNPLDNSAVHPEAYPIVEKMAQSQGVPVQSIIGNKAKIRQIDPTVFQTPTVGLLALQDILKELEKPGLDPRKAATVFEFDPSIKTIDDIRTGMVIPGLVNNITAFGCFVDIGIKESGLVHISQLKSGFVSDVNEVVKLHQPVQVKVLEVDEARKRIQLTMVL
ncbi:MAG: RNA-binding transcriptional accessory protein [Flavobacterium sp. BFFFF2]|nr:MAG: RNA-binding transcriptional accessory protein [Flavobacterium sp. BFFFF2]